MPWHTASPNSSTATNIWSSIDMPRPTSTRSTWSGSRSVVGMGGASYSGMGVPGSGRCAADRLVVVMRMAVGQKGADGGGVAGAVEDAHAGGGQAGGLREVGQLVGAWGDVLAGVGDQVAHLPVDGVALAA